MYQSQYIHRQCIVCGKIFLGSPRTKYHDYTCYLASTYLRHSPTTKKLIKLLFERDKHGVYTTGRSIELLEQINWLDIDSDGYAMLSEHGAKAARYYYPELFEVSA